MEFSTWARNFLLGYGIDLLKLNNLGAKLYAGNFLPMSKHAKKPLQIQNTMKRSFARRP
jgi:hypothetical protein